MDHLTGLPGADRPVRNPREYFLKLLNIHLFRVRGEWGAVVMKMKHSLREYEQVCSRSLLSLGVRNVRVEGLLQLGRLS
jgi:hypothetical protein